MPTTDGGRFPTRVNHHLNRVDASPSWLYSRGANTPGVPVVDVTVNGYECGTSIKAPVTPQDVNLCVAGHRVSEDFLEFMDGLFVGKCDLCRAKIIVARMPGGSTPLRVKSLLMGLLESEKDFSNEQLRGLLELRDVLQKEAEAVEAAERMLALAFAKVASCLED